MALKKPLAVYGGQIEELRAGDELNAAILEVDVITLTNNSGSTIPGGGVVYISASNEVSPAQANSDATAKPFGLAVASIADAASGKVQTDGSILSVSDWSAITGSASLTAGARYYLSAASAGQMTTTPPSGSGEYVIPLGRAVSTTDFEISLGTSIKLA